MCTHTIVDRRHQKDVLLGGDQAVIPPMVHKANHALIAEVLRIKREQESAERMRPLPYTEDSVRYG